MITSLRYVRNDVVTFYRTYLLTQVRGCLKSLNSYSLGDWKSHASCSSQGETLREQVGKAAQALARLHRQKPPTWVGKP
ncbi:MAG: hypothetical protein KME54_15825 [Tolypothrix brevis GSE-NOS-MK-07-07A]|nr:hypothetical protein [Tolypothrix brevis GSE-NOS-MK-07-07A]